MPQYTIFKNIGPYFRYQEDWKLEFLQLREATHFQPLKWLHLYVVRVSWGGNFPVHRNRIEEVSIIF